MLALCASTCNIAYSAIMCRDYPLHIATLCKTFAVIHNSNSTGAATTSDKHEL